MKSFIRVCLILSISIMGLLLFGCQKKDEVSEYTKYLGRNFEELPSEYIVEEMTSAIFVAKKENVTLFGETGSINMHWYKGAEPTYTDNEIVTLTWAPNDNSEAKTNKIKEAIIKKYGEYDSMEEVKDASQLSGDLTIYSWNDADGRHVALNIYEDHSVFISWKKKID